MNVIPHLSRLKRFNNGKMDMFNLSNNILLENTILTRVNFDIFVVFDVFPSLSLALLLL